MFRCAHRTPAVPAAAIPAVSVTAAPAALAALAALVAPAALAAPAVSAHLPAPAAAMLPGGTCCRAYRCASYSACWLCLLVHIWLRLPLATLQSHLTSSCRCAPAHSCHGV
ncbi:unnamed protein product [Closterium sp. Naga37s-1]|nr:unnamed protein product [Closterium sp. Naga37s-1]